jgi:hypothetical protein
VDLTPAEVRGADAVVILPDHNFLDLDVITANAS